MKISKKIIKAMALKDMFSWISNFESNGLIKEYDEETQETYWDFIKKMQERIFKEL